MDGQQILRNAIEHLNQVGDDEHWRASGFLWTLIEPLPTVTTVLGETRPATWFAANGDYECPFCTLPILRTQGKSLCENPMCDAHPAWTPELLRQRIAKREAEAQELARRKRDNEWSAKWRREQEAIHQQEYDAARQESKEQGFCFCCWRKNGKKVHHRAECPRDRKNIYASLGMNKVRSASGRVYYE